MKLKFLARAAVAAMAAMAAFPASAALVTFDLSNAGTVVNGQVRTFTRTQNGATVNVRASAWSRLNGTTLAAAYLGSYSEGLGVTNSQDGGSGYHTVDNVGSLDFIAFQFDQVVELETARLRPFTTGSTYPDNDSSVNWSGAGMPWTSTVSAATLAPLLTTMTQVNGTGDPWIVNLNPGNKTGSLWLIGASFMTPDRKSDGFKIDYLKVNTVPMVPVVPEPATWAMMIVGFGLVGGTLRRRARRTLAAA